MAGTYVAVNAILATELKLADHFKNANVNLAQDLHCTILYSRNACPNIKTDKNILYRAKFNGYDLFGKDDEKILVARLSCKELSNKHDSFVQNHGATHDYPVYNPHLTLDENFDGQINQLPPITFDLFFNNEYIEDLEE